MRFNKPYTRTEQIQLLQRWILVQSLAYYELNENIASDFKYDANSKQLSELMNNYPEDAKRSRYHKYFYDWSQDQCTSGFNLLERVRKDDEELYRFMHINAYNAFDMKAKYGTQESEEMI
jgi:hypothetical protein